MAGSPPKTPSESLSRIARPMLFEVWDVGPMDRERLQDALMFDDPEYDAALGELVLHGLALCEDGVVRVTAEGSRVAEEAREG